MKRTSNPHAEEQLAQLATQFDHWRQRRTTRAERIPPRLWQQATALTTVLPFSRVAKCLRVSWSDLRKQCVSSHTNPVDNHTPTPLRFVEVPPVSVRPFPPPGTTIELHRPDGVWLRMHSRESQVPLTALLRTFLETPGCSS
jgi:hypothetical protein